MDTIHNDMPLQREIYFFESSGYFIGMQDTNCSAVIIKPKRPFAKWVNWANSVSSGDFEQPYKHFLQDCSVVAIPKCLTYKEARTYINSRWEEIFAAELGRQYISEALWPRDRTQKMFWLWFGMEFHSWLFQLE